MRVFVSWTLENGKCNDTANDAHGAMHEPANSW